MLTFPNAKINIGLNILRKRPDGYHDLASCFYPIGLSDALEAIPAQKAAFKTVGQGIRESEVNLVSKAINLLAKDHRVPPLSVFLLKGIPIGAGLGGGSADAAFMIGMLNDMLNLRLSADQQEDYARQLGSDCAFFVRNVPMYCYEKGDRFEEIGLSLKGLQLFLVNPGIHVSTPAAYAGVTPAIPPLDLREALAGPISGWKDNVVNDFEKSVFQAHPELAIIKNRLYDAGALYASMSGSGSSVYGIFQNLETMRNKFKNCFVWQGELN
ncbi:4-(cytidine 5'-diphospho)-2-C-methyl-D-erythritol kinase [Ravibacter arvi]|uniref:4-diphosphocytidyl-2-C-methyl-D-erythritol kinase n=1 Tax=Ravibacter arvi TaxID=2051041 RepID=A0ABP8M0K3_9BACT